MIALLLAVALCGTADDPGITMYDGTCMTVSRYNATFSYENLSNVESQAFPGQSVAEVYGLDPDDTTEPADRPLGGGVSARMTTFRLWLSRL